MYYFDTVFRTSISSVKTAPPGYNGRRYERIDTSLPNHRCSNSQRPHKINISRTALKLLLEYTKPNN